MLSLLFKRHRLRIMVDMLKRPAVAMVFSSPLTLATFVVVVVVARFNLWDYFSLPLSKLSKLLALGLR